MDLDFSRGHLGLQLAGVTFITRKRDGKLGKMLADGQENLTVYLFEGDPGESS
jgi:hypothetical protein